MKEENRGSIKLTKIQIGSECSNIINMVHKPLISSIWRLKNKTNNSSYVNALSDRQCRKI
jgi:hypothetical protein